MLDDCLDDLTDEERDAIAREYAIFDDEDNEKFANLSEDGFAKHLFDEPED